MLLITVSYFDLFKSSLLIFFLSE